MKFRGLILLIGGLVAGFATYGLVYFGRTSEERQLASTPEPAIAWLCREYGLNGEQTKRLAALHDAYLPKCADMCRRIEEKNSELRTRLSLDSTVTPEIRTLLAEAAQLRAECHANMLEHFNSVAKTMPPEQGRRYLAWIQEQTLGPASVPAGGVEGHLHHRMQ